MNKRDEIAEIFCTICEEQTHRLGWCTDELQKDICTLLSKVLSIINRIPCPECGGTGKQKHHPIWKHNTPDKCPSCKDGWIYPIFLTPDEARIIRELAHSEGGKNWKKIRDGLISKVKQTIKGE